MSSSLQPLRDTLSSPLANLAISGDHLHIHAAVGERFQRDSRAWLRRILEGGEAQENVGIVPLVTDTATGPLHSASS